MKHSAGILIYRQKYGKTEVLLAHPGGPFWSKKDLKSWGLIKGEVEGSEDLLSGAKREFEEEVGRAAPEGEYIELGSVKIPGKIIYGWAVEADFDNSNISSNLVEVEWPPKSGKNIKIPEIDRAEWFEISSAIPKMHGSQAKFLERLAEHLDIKLHNPEQPHLF